MLKQFVFAPLGLLVLAGATSFVIAASVEENTAASTPALNLDLGKTDYMTYCAACHGVSGKGDGSIAEFLTISAADLTQMAKLNAGIYPRERVIEVIDGRREVKVHGPRDMPVWGDWFRQEARAEGKGGKASEEIVRERINMLADYIGSIQE